MNAIALRLKEQHASLMAIADAIEQLPVRGRYKRTRDMLVIDLDDQIGRTRDTLSVYGFGDPGERRHP